MSMDELLADEDTGAGIRVREDARSALLGERANADFRNAWATHYNTDFDRTNGNVDAEYEAYRKRYADALPDEIARGNFYRLTDDHKGRVVASDTEEKITVAKGQINATIVDSWNVQIGDMIAKGETDPAKIAGEVFSSSKANGQFFGLSGTEQNETVWRLAERMAAEGNPEIVEALLKTERVGADGKPVPALATLAVDDLLAFAAREPVVAAPDTAEQTATDYFTQNPDCRIRVASDE